MMNLTMECESLTYSNIAVFKGKVNRKWGKFCNNVRYLGATLCNKGDHLFLEGHRTRRLVARLTPLFPSGPIRLIVHLDYPNILHQSPA